MDSRANVAVLINANMGGALTTVRAARRERDTWSFADRAAEGARARVRRATGSRSRRCNWRASAAKTASALMKGSAMGSLLLEGKLHTVKIRPELRPVIGAQILHADP